MILDGDGGENLSPSSSFSLPFTVYTSDSPVTGYHVICPSEIRMRFTLAGLVESRELTYNQIPPLHH